MVFYCYNKRVLTQIIEYILQPPPPPPPPEAHCLSFREEGKRVGICMFEQHEQARIWH